MDIKEKSVIFWPVGTGDSTTLVLTPGQIVMQIDLRHLAKADHKDSPEWPVIDHLIKLLPRKKNGRPYLALFVLTHPDKDHILGFKELLSRVDIGEIWHTPKIFRDLEKHEVLCEDALVFRKEAHRRRKAIADNPLAVKSGDRLRVIGHDDILSEDDYRKLPETCKSRPGSRVAMIDGYDMKGHFQAFIHAPFSDDQAADRNNTSLSLNVVIWEGDKYGQFMFFGDREYPTIKQIFEVTEAHPDNIPYLYWNVMLCAHHCSKAVMYWKAEGEEKESFKKDIMDYFAKYSRQGQGYIVASATSDFTDEEGKNPPHKKARQQYEKIVKAGRFICTHEYPSKKSPEPIIFTVGKDGFAFIDKRKSSQGPAALGAAVSAARGSTAPPSAQTTFGVD